QAEDIEAALEALGEARQELTEALDPAALAKRTGLAGLEASFRQQPIGEGETAASQMRDLASRLEAGDQPDLADAIAQLEARAEDFAGVDPELSQALGDAADSLRRLATGQGDRAAAAEALERAAEVTERAHQAAADQEALARAAGELGDAQRRLAGEGEGEGRGEGQGQGRGEGQGQGQGQGQGEGQGKGEGQGQGQGQGEGGGGGGGSQGAGGQQGGQQGSGTGSGGMSSGGSGDDDPEVAPDRAGVFDPIGDALGERERVELGGGDDSGEVQGLTDGRGGVQNLPLVPYTDRFAD